MALDERIVPFSSEYRLQVIDLHKQEFSRFLTYHFEVISHLDTVLTPDKTLVVLVQDKVVGFSCFDAVHDSSFKDFYRSFLRAALNPGEYDSDFWSWLERLDKPGDIDLKYFPEFLTELKSSNIRFNRNDAHITEFAIHPDFRNNGLGLRLANATLDSIRTKMGSSNVYATIVENSPAYDVALKMGFIPLLKIGPFYDDGSAAIAIVKTFKE